MKLQVRVQQIVQETPEVRSFLLVPTDGNALPAFSAGAHIDVHLPGGLVRQYSLCNGPKDTQGYVIAVKREPASRGGSAALHDHVKEGDLLQIGAPRQQFSLQMNAAHHVLIGAGIGITPLLSMARHLVEAGASFEVHYFARSRELAPFRQALDQPEYAGKVQLHLGLGSDAVHATLHRLLGQRPANADLYLCGPRPFMASVRASAHQAWPLTAVHFEYFSADEAVLAAPQHSFVIRLGRSGGEYEVPADQTIVQVLGMHGIEIFTSCEQGVCGSCVTAVLDGTPDHRDSFLTDDEKQCGSKLMPCVSRAHSNVLVLDL